MGLAGSILNIYPPLGVWYQKKAFSRDPNMIPTIGDLIQMRYRGIIGDPEFRQTCAENGYALFWANSLYEASESLLNGYEYLTLWRRGKITDNELSESLSTLHYNEEVQDKLKKVTEYFPNPADLVRFAVREVYSPEIAARFGLFEDLPQVFIDEAYKAGMTEELSRAFWGAHWELPGAREGFEMLHRRIIDEGDLKLLLRALDVMPYWRDKLIQLSYNPLTRVDVRRMYRLGVVDEEGVYSAYLDLGYSPENAELMTEFTKVYESDETVGLSRANIITAYKRGLININELREFLFRFGYAQEVINFWISTAEYEKAYEQITNETTELIQQYLQGQLTIDQVRDELNKKDLPAAYVNEQVEVAVTEKSKKIKMPTKADLEDWLELSIITESQYKAAMSNLGYLSDDILNYLTEYAFKRDTSKRKYLNIKSYQRWLKVGIMDEDQFTKIATELKYSKEDIANLIMEVQPE